jgi:hypothetical protein
MCPASSCVPLLQILSLLICCVRFEARCHGVFSDNLVHSLFYGYDDAVQSSKLGLGRRTKRRLHQPGVWTSRGRAVRAGFSPGCHGMTRDGLCCCDVGLCYLKKREAVQCIVLYCIVLYKTDIMIGKS